MRPGWKLRTALWLALAESARANRNAYPDLPTSWVPHLVTNSLALWFPEAVTMLNKGLDLEAHWQRSPELSALYETLRDLCLDNPGWGGYIAPVTLGYILSHPRYSIYKGEWGELRFLGMGLDSIPHSGAAFSLSLLLQHGIVALARNLSEQSSFAPPVQALARHSTLFSGVVLLLLTAIWESGERWVHQEELRRMHGDETAINMEWSAEDTVTDIISNALGWLAAAIIDTRNKESLSISLAK